METFTNLFKRQLVQVELTQQSPSQSTSSSHDNPKHLSRHCTSSTDAVQHLNSQFCPGIHYLVLASTTRLCKTINDLNNITSKFEYEWLSFPWLRLFIPHIMHDVFWMHYIAPNPKPFILPSKSLYSLKWIEANVYHEPDSLNLVVKMLHSIWKSLENCISIAILLHYKPSLCSKFKRGSVINRWSSNIECILLGNDCFPVKYWKEILAIEQFSSRVRKGFIFQLAKPLLEITYLIEGQCHADYFCQKFPIFKNWTVSFLNALIIQLQYTSNIKHVKVTGHVTLRFSILVRLLSNFHQRFVRASRIT